MKKIFKNKYPFELSDYKNFDHENRSVILLEDQNCDDFLEIFFQRIIKVINDKSHFPILRLADGEYQFLFGKKIFNRRKGIYKNLFDFIKLKLSILLYGNKIDANTRRGVSSGRYSGVEIIKLRPIFINCIKYISQSGILAPYTIVKPNFYIDQYFAYLERLLNDNKIELTTKNYVPFYFVYILLTNKKYRSIYINKNIHLITTITNKKQINVENTLYAYGAKSISWTNISSARSFYDNIEVDKISMKTDIVFVGAGIGKVNIFYQLREFPALIIDAGYVFEIWSDNELAIKRDYCLADNVKYD